jgi:hypothetical protein
MSVQGIASLVQSASEHLIGQTQEAKVGTPPPEIEFASNEREAVDKFTPSTQDNSAQEAGIFQATSGTIPALPANLIFPQIAPSGSQDGAPGQPTIAESSGAEAAQSAPANGKPDANANQEGATAPAAQATISSAAAANAQAQIQALNAALPALGLTNAEIQQIDRIASLVQNFNPAAYANLVTQFETLAQQLAPANAVNAAAIPGTNSAAGGGFQVQEISIQFAGAQNSAVSNAQASSGVQDSAANPGLAAGIGLQLAQVQFTFTSADGQTIHVQALQQSTATRTTNSPTA